MVVCSNRCRPLRSRDLLSLHVRQASAIHGLCGVIVIATFPIAATLYGSALARRQDWMAARRLLRWATVLVWLGLLSFAGSTVVLGIISQPVDRSNPNLLIGWQNRFMIVTYSLWLMAVMWQVAFHHPRRA
jgi:hypothetical protein